MGLGFRVCGSPYWVVLLLVVEPSNSDQRYHSFHGPPWNFVKDFSFRVRGFRFALWGLVLFMKLGLAHSIPDFEGSRIRISMK